ncbi:hypothetical protein QJS10_CPB17g00621 [Acorus calamus]|uniref:Uncharacterized protein n=1 Tax=Acorus calamus TaxID=4465 RepID=A0AAV9CXZ8_ACOCL|nr:hypothetical protein QJS10_CPB17g00621 [Acorus calamus]
MVREVWSKLGHVVGQAWNPDTLDQLWEPGCRLSRREDRSIRSKVLQTLVPAVMWAIWRGRNDKIFVGTLVSPEGIWEGTKRSPRLGDENFYGTTTKCLRGARYIKWPVAQKPGPGPFTGRASPALFERGPGTGLLLEAQPDPRVSPNWARSCWPVSPPTGWARSLMGGLK